ncbi:MAG TPA: flagellar protein FlbB, partial [Turneriella sp.]|nr:flagellar protein FlbB [Turneriella sp.]
MNQKRFVIFLLLLIVVFSGGIFYALNSMGIIRAADIFPFLASRNPVRVEDKEYPTEVEKVEFQKWEQKLIEREEALARREAELKEKQSGSDDTKRELEETRIALKAEKEKFILMQKEWEDRQKKVKDLAEKVRNMPPIKAQEMMQNWRDFDIIDVMRQMDKDAETEGTASIVPYLLTLFQPDRRAERRWRGTALPGT